MQRDWTDTRRTQMKWLLALTALSLVPVYVLIGWQSSGHGPDSVASWFWLVEAGAWGLRALVEAWALIYLFQTNSPNNRLLTLFECLLIGLIALTVGLVIIANGSKQSISTLPTWLFWIWAFSVAAFAPLMMGSVGYAYKVHRGILTNNPEVSRVTNAVGRLPTATNIELPTDNKDTNAASTPASDPANHLAALADKLNSNPKPTNKQLAADLGVSMATIGNWKRQLALNGKANGNH